MKKFFILFLSVLTFALSGLTCFAAEVPQTYALTEEQLYDYNGIVLESMANEYASDPDKYQARLDEGYKYFYLYVGANGTYYMMQLKENAYINSVGALVGEGYTYYYYSATATGDRGTWSPSAEQSAKTAYVAEADEKLKWASVDVYDHNGNLFMSGDRNFHMAPPKIWEIPIRIAGEQMTVKIPELAKAMGGLLACGIILLASLVVLEILPRVLRRFLA